MPKIKQTSFPASDREVPIFIKLEVRGNATINFGGGRETGEGAGHMEKHIEVDNLSYGYDFPFIIHYILIQKLFCLPMCLVFSIEKKLNGDGKVFKESKLIETEGGEEREATKHRCISSDPVWFKGWMTLQGRGTTLHFLFFILFFEDIYFFCCTQESLRTTARKILCTDFASKDDAMSNYWFRSLVAYPLEKRPNKQHVWSCRMQ